MASIKAHPKHNLETVPTSKQAIYWLVQSYQCYKSVHIRN